MLGQGEHGDGTCSLHAVLDFIKRRLDGCRYRCGIFVVIFISSAPRHYPESQGRQGHLKTSPPRKFCAYLGLATVLPTPPSKAPNNFPACLSQADNTSQNALFLAITGVLTRFCVNRSIGAATLVPDAPRALYAALPAQP